MADPAEHLVFRLSPSMAYPADHLVFCLSFSMADPAEHLVFRLSFSCLLSTFPEVATFLVSRLILLCIELRKVICLGMESFPCRENSFSVAS